MSSGSVQNLNYQNYNSQQFRLQQELNAISEQVKTIRNIIANLQSENKKQADINDGLREDIDNIIEAAKTSTSGDTGHEVPDYPTFAKALGWVKPGTQ